MNKTLIALVLSFASVSLFACGGKHADGSVDKRFYSEEVQPGTQAQPHVPKNCPAGFWYRKETNTYECYTLPTRTVSGAGLKIKTVNSPKL